MQGLLDEAVDPAVEEETPAGDGGQVRDRDYVRLLTLRTRLRQFEHWSADRAAAEGLTGSQHQLLLAIRGHQGPAAPTVNDIAGYLMVSHNTAVGLIDRVERLGLVTRTRDADDHRRVRLTLTPDGAERLARVTGPHIGELTQLERLIRTLTHTLAQR